MGLVVKDGNTVVATLVKVVLPVVVLSTARKPLV